MTCTGVCKNSDFLWHFKKPLAFMVESGISVLVHMYRTCRLIVKNPSLHKSASLWSSWHLSIYNDQLVSNEILKLTGENPRGDLFLSATMHIAVIGSTGVALSAENSSSVMFRIWKSNLMWWNIFCWVKQRESHWSENERTVRQSANATGSCTRKSWTRRGIHY